MQLNTCVCVCSQMYSADRTVIGKEVRAWFILAIQFMVRNPQAIYTLCWRPN